MEERKIISSIMKGKQVNIALFGTRYYQLLPFFIGSILLPFFALPLIPSSDLAKWLFIYSLAVISLAFPSAVGALSVPSLTRVQKYLLILIILGLTFNYFYHDISIFEKETLDRVLFWVLFLHYCSTLKNLNEIDKISLYTALFWGSGLFIICAFLNFIFIKPSLAFTFFNLNKSAEFIGFSLALQLGLISQYQGRGRNVLFGLISLSFAFLYFAHCRSAYLGMMGVMIYLLSSRHLSLKTFAFILGGSCAAILFFHFVFIGLGIYPVTFSVKEGSITERWHLILNTLSLIRDFPLGVGLGRYEWAAVPYMKFLPQGVFTENYNLFSPHNEALRFMAEEGILLSLLILAFFMSFIFPFQRLKEVSKQCPESVAVFIFFIFQFLFQFPLIQPFPIFLIPFVLAYTLHYTQGFVSFSFPPFQWVSRGFSVYVCLSAITMGFFIYIGTSYFYNITVQKTVYYFYKDKNILNNILFVEHINKNYAETKKYALKGLEREPQNLNALKYLGLSTLMEGDLVKGCDYLKAYDASYQGSSSVCKEIQTHCKE